MELDTNLYQPYSKRSKYDLNSKFSHETDFKQDLMIISFESNAIHTLTNKKIVEKSKPLTESDNKLLGLANIALEREIT